MGDSAIHPTYNEDSQLDDKNTTNDNDLYKAMSRTD